MSVPDRHRSDVDRLPTALRELLDAELAAGNSIAEVSSTFPAPPAGLYVMLARPVTTRPHASLGDVQFYARNTPQYSGEFHDARRFYFVLEPPLPPPAEPDMHAIRAARDAQARASASHDAPRGASPDAPGGTAPGRTVGQHPAPSPGSPLARFLASMAIDYDKWREGIGYDLEALRAASPAERATIEGVLINHWPRGWRDVEALAQLSSDAARAALRDGLRDDDAEVRAAVVRHAPQLVSGEERLASLLRGIAQATSFHGLDAVLSEAADYHPAPVVDALFRAALHRSGDVAVHFAALLFFLHGLTDEPFDWDHRPFFLRFHTEDRAERESAFRELCASVKVEAARFL